MADLEPHTLKSENEQAPEGLDIYWDSNNHYGIGKENDQLLKRTLNILQRASFELSPLKLKESVSFYISPNMMKVVCLMVVQHSFCNNASPFMSWLITIVQK